MVLEPGTILTIVVTAVIALLLILLIYCLPRSKQDEEEVKTLRKDKKEKDITKQVQIEKNTSTTNDKDGESDVSKQDPEPNGSGRKDSGEPIPEKPEEQGELSLRIGYIPSSEKLTVVLLKAKNLKCYDNDDKSKLPDPYISVAIIHDGNIFKEKKTSTKHETSNPTYNQAIKFAVPLDILPHVGIQLRIVNDSGAKTIGYLEIGPDSTGEEHDHWMKLMNNKPAAQWHKLKKFIQDSLSNS